MTTPTITPQREKVVVRLLPETLEHGAIYRATTETVIRRVEVLAVGPDAANGEVGKVYLANILAGQQIGDDTLLLPDKRGASALLAIWENDDAEEG